MNEDIKNAIKKLQDNFDKINKEQNERIKEIIQEVKEDYERAKMTTNLNNLIRDIKDVIYEIAARYEREDKEFTDTQLLTLYECLGDLAKYRQETNAIEKEEWPREALQLFKEKPEIKKCMDNFYQDIANILPY